MPKPPKIKGSPLTPHANGQYCKKINSRLYYFGTEHDSALRFFYDTASAIADGVEPAVRHDADRIAIVDLVNLYLEARHQEVESGQLTPRQFTEYRSIGRLLVAHFGRSRSVESIGPSDFGRLRASMSKKWKTARLTNQIGRVRTIFKWAKTNGHIAHEARFGNQFERPSARARRLARGNASARMFTPAEIRRLIDAAPNVRLKTSILLGINCGFGNKDCSDLLIEQVDLERGIIDHRREKTGIERTATLWPETIEAIRGCIDRRTQGRVLITRFGMPYVRDRVHTDPMGRVSKVTPINSIAREFRKLKPSRGFYALRHTFSTVAHDTGDVHAVARIMGHSLHGMAAVYVQRIRIERLQLIAQCVHDWLHERVDPSNEDASKPTSGPT